MANRITWKTGSYSVEYGLVNGVRVFTLSMSTTRGEGYRMQTKLPGFKEHLGPYRDREEAKERAEVLLAHFVEKIGATFK